MSEWEDAMTFYQELIIKATGASGTDVEYLEDIMRNDIFHSTLDWQTRAQLARGAREAVMMLKLYRADPFLAKQFPKT
jgi:hypothetical protein